MDDDSDDEDVVMSATVGMVRNSLVMMTVWLVGYQMQGGLQ
jgi:hypothetical protein